MACCQSLDEIVVRSDCVQMDPLTIGVFLAPETIPGWFHCKMPAKPEQPDLPEDEDQRQDVDEWVRAASKSCPPRPLYNLAEKLQSHQQAWQDHWKALDLWADACQMERYFAWRIFFAQRMAGEIAAARVWTETQESEQSPTVGTQIDQG